MESQVQNILRMARTKINLLLKFYWFWS